MNKIPLRYGLMMLGGFILLFLLMHMLGLSGNYKLRMLNGVIHLGVIYLAIREYVKVKDSTDFNYLAEVAIGMYTSLFGVVGFTIFMTFFMTFNHPFFAEVKAANPNISEYLTPFTASLFLLVEGIIISVIGSYVIARVVGMKREMG